MTQDVPLSTVKNRFETIDGVESATVVNTDEYDEPVVEVSFVEDLNRISESITSLKRECDLEQIDQGKMKTYNNSKGRILHFAKA